MAKKKTDTMKEKCGKTKNPYMRGKMIEPLNIAAPGTVKDFIDEVFGASGYNARRLAEACEVYRRMIESGATVALTLAGAMTPIGMSGPVIEMMQRGFVDFIISTGANLYHDFHRAFNFPVTQGSANADDAVLHKYGVARIYDTFISDNETLLPTDAMVIDAVIDHGFKKPVSTAKLHRLLGESVLLNAPLPEKSLVAQAVECGVPIFTSSPGDSSIAMNMVVPNFFGAGLVVDPTLDIIETTAIVREAGKNGVVIVGGGSPKNFYMQTQPTLWQILQDDIGGHDYFIQLTTDSPHWGGLSGATPQEAHSWGKVKEAPLNQAVVYSCASITFPLICKYIMETVEPRPRKNLLGQIDKKAARLKKSAMANPAFVGDYKKLVKNKREREARRKSGR
ncbi:MAG: deoxyhypusine synthase [bacterium]